MTLSRIVNIIMYHYVRNINNSRYPKIKGLEVSQFRSQIDYLKEENFNFISTENLLDAIDNKVSLPEKAVFLTFDDGYIDHYKNVFPILRDEGIPAFFSMPGKILAEHKLLDVNKIHFILASMPVNKLLPKVYERMDYYRGQEFAIPANEELYKKLAVKSRFDNEETIFIKRILQVELNERLRSLITDDLFLDCISIPEEAFVEELYLSYDQVKLMNKEGMTFGIHGYDHYWMNSLSPKALDKDITLALETFSGIVDSDRWICCYPYGSCSDSVVNHIKTKGAVAGLTTQVSAACLDEHDRFMLPRFDTNDFPPKSLNYKNYK